MFARSYALLSSIVLAGAILLALLLVLLLPAEVLAATLTVGSDCPTLADCHAIANPGDTIQIPAGNFATHLTITKKLTLNGAGQTSTFLDGEGSHRVLHIPVAVPVTLTNLTIRNGAIVTPAGAAVYAAGALTLDQVAVTDNVAPNGAGIWSGGVLRVSNSEFARNECTAPLCLGGGILATAATEISASTFISNAGVFGSGIWTDADLTVTDSLFTQNSGGGVRSEGGVVYSLNNEFLNNSAPEGGGAHVATGTFIDNVFVANHCLVPGCFGGALFIDDSAVISGGQFLDNFSDSGGGAIWVRETVVMTGSLVENNRCLITTCPGAGLFSGDYAVVVSSVFSNNVSAGDGGGVFAFADMQLEDVSLLHNSASNDGGGAWANGTMTAISITVFANESGVRGGGLFAVAGLELTNAAVTSNVTGFNGGGVATLGLMVLSEASFSENLAGDSGGGAWTDADMRISASQFSNNEGTGSAGAVAAFGNGYVERTTVSHNETTGNGGGIFIAGTGVISDVIVSHNQSQNRGGGIYAGAVTLYGSDVASNIAALRGGGVFAATDLTVTLSTLDNNRSGFLGGGAVGNIVRVFSSTLSNNDCVGSPCLGGGLASGQNLLVENSLFRDNSSGGIGGAVYTVGPAAIHETFFSQNQAGSTGGALYHDIQGAASYRNVVLDDNRSSGSGAAIHFNNGTASTMTHATIATRQTQLGEAIWNQNSNLSVVNSIFAFHALGIRGNMTTVVQRSIFFGNAADVFGFTLGPDNLFGNPQLGAPLLGNYFLADGSVAIDSALASGVARDILGNARPFGAASDIGAFEAGYTETALKVAMTAPLTTDLLPGQPVTYTIAYQNEGVLPAAQVVISNIVPAGFTNLAYGSSRPITQTGSNPFVWDAGTLAPLETGLITVTGRIDPAFNTATDLVNSTTIVNSAGLGEATLPFAVTPPQLVFDVNAITVTELAAQVSLTVTLASANPYADVVINFTTVAGTALPGEDFVAASGMFTIPAGTTASEQIQITILHNILKESSETFTVALTTAGAVAPAPATITILDSDYGVYLPISRRRN